MGSDDRSRLTVRAAEVVGTSRESFSAATTAAVANAARALGLDVVAGERASFQVLRMWGAVDDGRRSEFSVEIRAELS